MFCELEAPFSAQATFPKKLFHKSIIVKKLFCDVSSWGKAVFESYGYPFGYFRHCKIDEILTIVSFCIFKNIQFFEPERGAELGRPRLVSFKLK